MRVLLILALLASTQACWFTSRAKIVNKIVAYSNEHFNAREGYNIDKGMSSEELEHALNNLPGAIKWAVKKAGGHAKVMKRCDLNGDGFITSAELRIDSDCLSSCWKQSAISAFL